MDRLKRKTGFTTRDRTGRDILNQTMAVMKAHSDSELAVSERQDNRLQILEARLFLSKMWIVSLEETKLRLVSPLKLTSQITPQHILEIRRGFTKILGENFTIEIYVQGDTVKQFWPLE